MKGMSDLKIAQVDTYPLFYQLTKPYGDANGYKDHRALFLIRVTTESGIVGWGECADWLPALQVGFDKRITPFLIGKQASDRLKLVRHITTWHRRAAAAVSMALMDIMAKSAGVSICDLWGGKWREEVPVYASFQSYIDEPGWIEHSLHLIEQATERGYRRMKVKVGGRTMEEDQMHIRHVQERFGESCEFILDANESYDYATACQWKEFFSEWDNFLWFEEPLPMKLSPDYRLLRTSLSIPVAGGENLKSTTDFLSLLSTGTIDIIQPDVAHMDGIDAYRHTLQLSRDFGVRTSPHTYDGALSRLYALFAQACLPPWSKMQGEGIEFVEWDAMENPFTRIMPIEPVAGQVTIPVGVGIGLEPDQTVIEQYLWDGSMY